MNTLNNVLLITHVTAGFIALLLFWVQAGSRKGGPRHRKLGKIYVYLMWGVVISAAMLCIVSFVNGRTIIASFLMFISLITAKPLWLGNAVLKVRKSLRDASDEAQLNQYRKVNVGFNVLIVAAGAALMSYGLYLGGQGLAILLMIFGGLGLANIADLWASLRDFNSKDLSQWMKDHISGMGASGIAAHTAFLVFGANRFLPDVITQSYWSFVPWIAPTIIGSILIRKSVHRYQPKTLAKQEIDVSGVA